MDKRPTPVEAYPLRSPCMHCGEQGGVIKPTNGQDCVYCQWCGAWQYNAPRAETGREIRHLTDRGRIKPKVRAQVLIRAGRRCELCGRPVEATSGLAVDHMLSVEDGHAWGLTDAQLDNIENLAAMCELCNSGKGRITLPLYLVVAILQARTARADTPEAP